MTDRPSVVPATGWWAYDALRPPPDVDAVPLIAFLLLHDEKFDDYRFVGVPGQTPGLEYHVETVAGDWRYVYVPTGDSFDVRVAVEEDLRFWREIEEPS